MFFIVSKIIGQFILPLSVALLALLAFRITARRDRKPRWGLFWFGLIVLWFFSAPWGADLLLAPLERPFMNQPPPAKADVILVLGGALDLARSEPGRPEYTAASDRFMYAVKLARQHPEAKIIFAGGTASLVDHSKTEASILKAEAADLGVDPARIHVDDKSRNTRENALEARRVLEETGGGSVVVLTSAFHMRRSLACLRKAGVQATPYAVDFRSNTGGWVGFGWIPQAGVLVDGTYAMREYVGLLAYRLRGYI